MNADRFRGGGEALGQPVVSSRAEGQDFIADLAVELERDGFSKPRTALFGVQGGALAVVCNLVKDLNLEPDPHAGRPRHRRRREAAHALELP